MASPDNNLPKQTRWHKGPLLGMAFGLIVVGLLVFWFAGSTDESDTAARGTASPDDVAVEPDSAEADTASDAETPRE